MDARYYINILAHNIEESARRMNIADDFIFQQDNDPKYTAAVTKRFENTSINLLEWPAQSADLNPNENLWSRLDSKVLPSGRKNADIFYQNLQNAWNELSPNYLQKLVESMPRRLQAVIKAKAENSKY